MNEALNMALNYIGCKCYICDVGVAPTAANQIKGVTRISNPGGVVKGKQEYIPLENGVKKKVATYIDYKDTILDVAHEDEASIKLLDSLVITKGTESFKEFYYIPEKRSDWEESGAYKALVQVTESSPNDAVADGYQATSYTLSVSDKEAYTGTIA